MWYRRKDPYLWLVAFGALVALLLSSTQHALGRKGLDSTIQQSTWNYPKIKADETLIATVVATVAMDCVTADFNHDGKIDLSDKDTFEDVYGIEGAPGWVAQDMNRDGIVDISDVRAFDFCRIAAVETPTSTAETPITNTTTPTASPDPAMPTLTVTAANTPTPTLT